MSPPCPHPIKVYSDCVLMSYPPKKPWICANCGHQGVEMDRPPAFTYDALVEFFHGASPAQKDEAHDG